MTPEEWAKFLRDLSDRENEKGEATIAVCAALLDAAKVIERLSAEGAGLRKAARGPFFSLFLDGRNEHGTHLLPMGSASVADDYVMDQFSDPKDGSCEAVFQEAERLGFTVGCVIVTTWHWETDGDYSWLEYDGISTELTDLFWGGAGEQKRSMSAASGRQS